MSHGPRTYRFFLMTVDPVHIGTGGTRLGRVDLDIVREAGTRLPLIPGTSLHGTIRHYAAHRYGKPQCAGQGKTHCGRPTCPICSTFGYARDREGGRAGVVAIGDARILLFPVYSMVGPVWVTSPSALEAAGFGSHKVSPGQVCWGGNNSELPTDKPLNLGWLMVERENNLPSITWHGVPDQIQKRVVLVPDKLFSQIVNSNLEVRTSVSINPGTGAAEEGALFTYEAIPRATVLWMDVVVREDRDRFPDKARWQEVYESVKESELPETMPEKETEVEKALRTLGYVQERPGPSDENDANARQNYGQVKEAYWRKVKDSFKAFQRVMESLDWKNPKDIVRFGLEWAEHLGVGGMGTRGFGRIRELAYVEVENHAVKEPCQPDTHGDMEETSS